MGQIFSSLPSSPPFPHWEHHGQASVPPRFTEGPPINPSLTSVYHPAVRRAGRSGRTPSFILLGPHSLFCLQPHRWPFLCTDMPLSLPLALSRPSLSYSFFFQLVAVLTASSTCFPNPRWLPSPQQVTPGFFLGQVPHLPSLASYLCFCLIPNCLGALSD